MPVTEAWQDDDMMSSGDESDNADLTDGVSSGDEWSDIGDTTNVTKQWHSLYSPLTRQYAAYSSRIERLHEHAYIFSIITMCF